MTKSQRIRIRPFAVPTDASDGRETGPRLSIEVNGRILPLARYIEIVGEIVPRNSAGWRRDTLETK